MLGQLGRCRIARGITRRHHKHYAASTPHKHYAAHTTHRGSVVWRVERRAAILQPVTRSAPFCLVASCWPAECTLDTTFLDTVATACRRAGKPVDPNIRPASAPPGSPWGAPGSPWGNPGGRPGWVDLEALTPHTSRVACCWPAEYTAFHSDTPERLGWLADHSWFLEGLVEPCQFATWETASGCLGRFRFCGWCRRCRHPRGWTPADDF